MPCCVQVSRAVYCPARGGFIWSEARVPLKKNKRLGKIRGIITMGITISPWMMAFLMLMTGFAGFVDSAAGGGG